MTKEQFEKALKEKGIELSSHQLEQFEEYMKLLIEWNQKMNLTAITEPDQIWQKHFYDSILPFIGQDFTSLCDIGSGAGFPGIPVKIVWPDTSLTLVEPIKKRCTFLKEVVDTLGLKDVTILNIRAEDLAKTHRARFDLVSARAVARLSILLELCTPLVKKDGWIIALKGRNGNQELENAAPAIKELFLKLMDTKEDALDDEERINFYFQKVKETPKKYPRAYSLIKKKPLEKNMNS